VRSAPARACAGGGPLLFYLAFLCSLAAAFFMPSPRPLRIGIEAQRLFRPHKHGMDIVALELIRHLRNG
jgi:hypothetical protein